MGRKRYVDAEVVIKLRVQISDHPDVDSVEDQIADAVVDHRNWDTFEVTDWWSV